MYLSIIKCELWIEIVTFYTCIKKMQVEWCLMKRLKKAMLRNEVILATYSSFKDGHKVGVWKLNICVNVCQWLIVCGLENKGRIQH